jgi:O-acetyl-ADP-ribose deacetylase (regulator of RNase III)
MPEPLTVDELVADLRVLRERGLVRLRHTDLANLRRLAASAPGQDEKRHADGHQAVESVLRAAVGNLGGGQLGAAAEATFGLDRGARDRPAPDRRRRAALVYNVSVERFRKYHERIVIEQVAEELLKLVSTPAGPAGPAALRRPEPRSQAVYAGRVAGIDVRVIIHIEQVELLADIDILVVPTNSYLELPQYYKSSVSAAVRRMAAVKSTDGQVLIDVVDSELTDWISKNARPGLPVAPGTVAPTSAGELARHGIRRLYHVATVSPRPVTDDYTVEPAAIVEGVRNALALARAERALFSPALASIAFPLLGAGRGGLDPATSFDWLWSALERQVAEAAQWELHFFTRMSAIADLMAARLSESGLSRPDIARLSPGS